MRALLPLLLLPISASAIWIDLKPEELLPETDYVVVASLSDVKRWTKGGTDFAKGTLNVSEVLSANKPESKPLILTWSNPSDLICPRSEHYETGGTLYVWLLQKAKDGTATANHPGQVLDLKQKRKIIKLLKHLSSQTGRGT